jgi:hypothetical protein
MDAGKHSCPTKAGLLHAWQTAAETYSKAVSDLSRQIGVLSKDKYEQLKQVAEQARERSRKAQAAVEAHIEEHGCDGNGEVAA